MGQPTCPARPEHLTGNYFFVESLSYYRGTDLFRGTFQKNYSESPQSAGRLDAFVRKAARRRN